ncbi:hypothetical protein TKK_0008670 [Trichogramma kaykai]|uniref:RING-type domain-containing protein n=1 Tax=Trichogramma kaykai TaxID=54128 RepID=A0ABD2VSQ8_9HYME
MKVVRHRWPTCIFHIVILNKLNLILQGVATANGQEQTLEEDSSNDEININGDSVLNANLMDNASNINENVYSENDQHENNPIRSVDDILAEIGSENQLCLENNPGEADERPVANEIRSVRVSYFERRFGNNSQRREGEASHSAEEPSVTDNHAAVNESSADNNSVVPKKKRRRTPRSKCELLGCEAKFHVLKLNCGHRFCVPCIKNFLTRECPHCRRAIGNYLPPNLQGGERWESDEAQALDTNFYRQVQTERMDLEQRAYDLNVDVDDLINGGEIEL